MYNCVMKNWKMKIGRTGTGKIHKIVFKIKVKRNRSIYLFPCHFFIMYAKVDAGLQICLVHYGTG